MTKINRLIGITTCLAILSIFTTFGQLSQKGTPMGLSHHKNLQISPSDFKIMPSIDLQTLANEDLKMDTIRGIPFRFGENMDVNLNPQNAGIWNYFEDGSRLWQLGIISKGAVSINLTFNSYHIPPGATLFVYTPEGKEIIGAFTHLNNQDDGYFATTLLRGDEVIIEYFEPAEVDFKGDLNLWRVTHGYRGPGALFEKGFGDSGSCNVNVECAPAEAWKDQIRSVGMMVTGSNGFCTGSLINNTENDGKPYFLSANHCYKDASTVVIWFNWQSGICSNPTTIPNHDAMSGAVNRARNTTSDFWLIELNQTIPDDYNVYFSGWNRTTESILNETVASIHHPRGDIKKFSWAVSGVQAASYLEDAGTGNTHWRIGSWSGSTTTEPGSSGSALFDSQGRIIGQLHGGYAACGNLLADWYGRFGVSWVGSNTNATRLSTWLDPYNSNINALSGYDPIIDAANPGAPAAISNISIFAHPDGELSAQVSWTNPSITFDGNVLTQLDSILIFRDGNLIHVIENPVIGGVEIYADIDFAQSGKYTYTIRSTNMAGISPPVNTSIYIGPDIPAAVENISLTDFNNFGLLTWDPSNEGLNGGVFSPSSIIRYQIVRNPDGALFVVDAPQTQLIDETLPGIGYYSYTIVPVNDVGPGGSATSDLVLLATDGAVFMSNENVTLCKGTFFDSGGPDANYQDMEDLTMTIFPETSGSKINIQFTAFDTEFDYDFLYVYDSDEVSNEALIGRFSGAGVPAPLLNIISTHPTGALTFTFSSDFSINKSGWRADISCFTPADDDLAAISLWGNTTPSVGLESVYTVKVSNLGFEAQSNYTVSLISNKDAVLASVQGTLIDPGQILDFLIPWIPTAENEGNMVIRGLVELDGDENPANNQTSSMQIDILPEGVQAVTIGSGTLLPAYRIPFDFYWKNGLTQTIYYPDEITIPEGSITGIAFYNQFSGNVTGKQIKIYMQHTALASMGSGFVPVTNNELVFNGTVDFPAGANTIYVALDKPFMYNGGNLLLTTHRVFEQSYYTVNEKFYLSTTSTRPNRTIQFNSDAIVIDPSDPPTSGSITYRDTHANTTLFFGSHNQSTKYSVTFMLDMSQVPSLIFDRERDEVYITGSMNEWEIPGSNPDHQLLTPSIEDPDIYTITLDLEAGEYQYKYYINPGWDGDEWPGDPDRVLLVSGNMTVSDEFAMGQWEYAHVQFIHNAVAETSIPFDIYIDEKIFIQNLQYRHNTAFEKVPAHKEFTISFTEFGDTPDNAFYSDILTFAKDSSYVFIIGGIAADAGYLPLKPLEVFNSVARKMANHSANADLMVFHGVTDAPELSIWNGKTSQKLWDIGYGDFSGFIELSDDNYVLEVKNEGLKVAAYLVPLADMNLMGDALTVVASGFLNPENNSKGPAFGLWMATSIEGMMTELPVVTRVNDLSHSQIKLYPNPANDFVMVSTSEEILEIKIINLKGQLISTYQTGDLEYRIDTSGLENGMYIITIYTPLGIHIRKLIIE